LQFTFIAKAKLRYVGLVNIFLSCYWELVDLNKNISRISEKTKYLNLVTFGSNS
jgi:hypothetical protein